MVTSPYAIDRTLPPPNLWNSPREDEVPRTPAPADDSGFAPERGQPSGGVEQTSWVPGGPVEANRSSRFADVLLPTEFSFPLSSARPADYRQYASPPQSEPSEHGAEHPVRRLPYY